jgi:hypothetical protein
MDWESIGGPGIIAGIVAAILTAAITWGFNFYAERQRRHGTRILVQGEV